MVKMVFAVLLLAVFLGACVTVDKRDPGYWGRYSAGNTP
jgi:hypothetical protein